MSDLTDRKQLRKTAEEIRETLIGFGSSRLVVRQRGKEVETGTKGWYIPLAEIDHFTIELWLDCFLGSNDRYFWCGLYSSKMTPIDELIGFMTPDFEFSQYTSAHIVASGRKFKKPPTPDELRHVIMEPGYYFGIYDGDNRRHTFAKRSCDLLDTFIAGRSVGDTTLKDIDEIARDRSLKPTVRKALIDARIGQGRFRREVERRWGGKCAVTGCATREVLRASHIKPWISSSNKERLDPRNGILLTSNFDALFDRFLISFDKKGKVLVSEQVAAKDQELLGLHKGLSCDNEIDGSTLKYMQRHREQLKTRLTKDKRRRTHSSR